MVVGAEDERLGEMAQRVLEQYGEGKRQNKTLFVKGRH